MIETAIKQNYWNMLLRFSGAAVLFWLLQFALQYYWISKDLLAESLVRSFAFSGATLFSAALFSSAIFKWYPKTTRHWRIRRYLGVAAVVFILIHTASVFHFYAGWNIFDLYIIKNPFLNPVIFSTLALPILLVMALTSTDRMVAKLGGRNWKTIHRFVYLAFIFAIFHFILINPLMLLTLPGLLLLFITTLAVCGQVFWFVRTARQRGFRRVGTWIGIGLIILVFGLALLYFLYK